MFFEKLNVLKKGVGTYFIQFCVYPMGAITLLIYISSM